MRAVFLLVCVLSFSITKAQKNLFYRFGLDTLNLIWAKNILYVKGDAVYSARAYYTALHPGAYFDDEQLCYGVFKKERPKLNDFASTKPEYNREFNLYPNPTSAELYIFCQLQTEEELIVEIFDVQGRLIAEKREVDNYMLFDLSAVSPGIYICKTRTSFGFSKTERVAINK